jgi:hypothetical protein
MLVSILPPSSPWHGEAAGVTDPFSVYPGIALRESD